MRNPIERWRVRRTVRQYEAAKLRLEQVTGQQFANLAEAEKWVAEHPSGETEQRQSP